MYGSVEEKLSGIVTRVTFHSQDTGWSVLKVSPFDHPNEVVAVTVHQCKVYAGATMDFMGSWTNHQKYGRQFKAHKVVEKKPASAAALEKYLGSGLIAGVGPKTARKIVKHFGENTLDVFEGEIERLVEVPGIAELKLKQISTAWAEHREIRKVMMFLQTHGISTLFAVKIFKEYGNDAIELVSENPYRLANDFYGIGFFSADQVALSLGMEQDSAKRIAAGIKHVLAASRDEGHCYLWLDQIVQGVNELLSLECDEKTTDILTQLEAENELKTRQLTNPSGDLQTCYYSKTLFYDEDYCAIKIKKLLKGELNTDAERMAHWMERYGQEKKLTLSDEQRAAVMEMAQHSISILTGGPGCGKTTTTKTLVALLLAMNKRVLLTAPTGRAAQRMGEVIGLKAKTIHRLLIWEPATGGFKLGEDNPLEGDVVIVDECSMLDISLTASLLKAIPARCQLVLIGDADQLPSVGAGNVLRDLIDSKQVPCFRLTKVFRQAAKSQIIQFAHQINQGSIPRIESPLKNPELWQEENDCMFIDSDEVTQEQAKFIARAKHVLNQPEDEAIVVQREKGDTEKVSVDEDGKLFFEEIDDAEPQAGRFQSLTIPSKFTHVDLSKLVQTQSGVDELRAVLKKIHPWSSLRYGLNATGMIQRLYAESIPRYLGTGSEIQILTPMTRGSLGTHNLNQLIQASVNPPSQGKPQLTFGEKVLRVGDRVIQRRNNYDLAVFNGDIGNITGIDTETLTCRIAFGDLAGQREVVYEKESLSELDLAYAITIHKSQGSEFDVVILPLMTQHFKMLFRNLIYTGLTRAKKMAIFVGTRKALSMAVRTSDVKIRQTALQELILS